MVFPASADPDIFPGTLTLFYYNNILHDYMYSLGFTEATFNFQQDNFGRGGAGRDGVVAQVQDGSGTDNANMSPSAEGSKPRMQMYVFTETVFRRTDGSFDFDIVGHEANAINNRASARATGLRRQGLAAETAVRARLGRLYRLLVAEDDVEASTERAYESHPPPSLHTIAGLIIRERRDSPRANGATTLRNTDFTPADSVRGSRRGEYWAATLWDMRELLIMKQKSGA